MHERASGREGDSVSQPVRGRMIDGAISSGLTIMGIACEAMAGR
jgi:hypothetical protein